MFRNLLARLFPDDPATATLGPDDADLALAALLVRVARADGHYGAREEALVTALIARRDGLTPEAAAERRAAAEMVEAEAPDTVRMTRILKARIPHEGRGKVLTDLWRVVHADGARHPHEDALMRLVANLLGVTDVGSAQARQAATRSPLA